MANRTNFMGWETTGTALITGASSGIGAEFARQLASQGFKLVLVARRKEMLDQLAAELSEKCKVTIIVLAADLATQPGIDLVATKIKGIDDLDILINNAGFGIPGGFSTCDFGRMVDMMRVHVDAPVHLSRAAIPAMLQRGRGAIVNTASIAAFNPAPGMYSPTKAFLVMLSECMAMELKGDGIRVQALCPGFTHTGFHETSDELKKLKASLPKGIWGTAAGVVKASLDGLRKGKDIVIPGLVNRFMMSFPKGIRKKVTANRKIDRSP
ncbi:MAG: SDR family oxidoreductase [Candidatus Lokiarchaeota archaeon]|nr:SDR family oxidoreductase [Candidatus Lokiarchaeota archaeon]